jgi:uncharacterized membrane protein
MKIHETAAIRPHMCSSHSSLAAWNLMALLVAVFPANINMAFNSSLMPDIPSWLRLPLQPVLIWWAYLYRCWFLFAPTGMG